VTAQNVDRATVGVLTVDDQDVFRDAARDVIAATPGFEPLAEVASGEEAIDAVRRVLPDLVLLDLRMPGMDGIETARHLTALGTGAVLVLISVEGPNGLAAAVLSCGAAALVRKQDFRPSLLRSLWDAHGRW